MHRGPLLLAAVVAALLAAAPATAAETSRQVEVVVGLEAPPLARAVASSRVLTTASRAARVDVRSPFGASYLRGLAASQRTVESRIESAIPAARVRWRYGVVLNGLAVVVPASKVDRLAGLPGVAAVYPSLRYGAQLDRTPGQIGAPALWGDDLSFAGEGIKIGIVDTGIDPTHPFFDPAGYTMPAGFPKGQVEFTSAKVIAARAFPPPSPKYEPAGRAVDPAGVDHGTHVAGIAAGNHISVPSVSRSALSGIAPKAYLGNYKVLTVPYESGSGVNGNSPEIAAGIEAAVRDGMDVLNISIGQVEIEPTRDVVLKAIDAAVGAGVVVAVAAGNSYSQFGDGSVGAIGNAPRAITAAAVSSSRGGPADVITSFSSGGPTPLSLRLKPDVAAPGGSVLSSVPAREGLWDVYSGTSMASPHVAGAAALLKQRHPGWTVAQVKSALMLTGDPTRSDGSGAEAPTIREGGGRINLVKADQPLMFAAPGSLSFGPVRPSSRKSLAVQLTDAGGGAGSWAVSVVRQQAAGGVAVTAPASVAVPGRLNVTAAAAAAARQGSYTGFVVLTRGETVRRIAFWVDADAPTLGRQKVTGLRRAGVYRGDTRGRPSLVPEYRYPNELSSLAGPEQVFRLRLTRTVANFGVVLLGSTRVQARIVVGGDENHLVGFTALPLNINPYQATYGEPVAAAGAVMPRRGAYDIVFDSPTRAGAGAFRFRLWIDDTKPPAARLLTSAVAAGGRLEFAVSDAGSGVDPASIVATVDGRTVSSTFDGRRVLVQLPTLTAGAHRATLRVADYQETKNNENVLRILPNTRNLTASFTVR